MFKGLYFKGRFFIAVGAVFVLFLFAFSYSWLYPLARLAFFGLMVLFLFDVHALFRFRSPLFARRLLPERLSNGNDNGISIYIENRYPFSVKLELIDELPFQFQKRDLVFWNTLRSAETKEITYQIRPVKRGEYSFGALNLFVSGRLGLIQRRFRFDQQEMVRVYPSFLQMRRFELLAISNRLREVGIKRVRRIGNSMEFEQVRNYVVGDDPRFINWKATARKNDIMLNAFQEERAQQVFSLIDKGRGMQMPFEGLSLMDYAINASLVLANTALLKGDKAGLVTFSDKIGNVVRAGRQRTHLNTILEVLYNQRTRFLEPNYELLYVTLRKQITQRSLLVLFTNFESLSSMKRQLPYLKGLARHHLLLTVFFENTELKDLLDTHPRDTDAIYLKTTVEKLAYEKRLVVRELNLHGIHALLTPPADLTINTINKYLEFKSRNLL
ncbi:MAG TPA: DUF58 domain-containing protein [Anseongella sp.]